MQSLHAAGAPLLPRGVRWRILFRVAGNDVPTQGYDPALPRLPSIGCPFQACTLACAHDTAAALMTNTRLFSFLQEDKCPAAKGPHLWRAVAGGGDAHTAPAAIRFLLSDTYAPPEPPGTSCVATEFDAFAVVAARVAIDDACEVIEALAAAATRRLALRWSPLPPCETSCWPKRCDRRSA
jgi:hypothetical protein